MKFAGSGNVQPYTPQTGVEEDFAMNPRTALISAGALAVVLPLSLAIAQTQKAAAPEQPAAAQGARTPASAAPQDPRFVGAPQGPQPTQPRPGFGGGGQFMGPPMAGGGGTAMVSDGNFLFIVEGGMIYKVDKGSLNVVNRMPLNPMPQRPNPGGFGGGGG